MIANTSPKTFEAEDTKIVFQQDTYESIDMVVEIMTSPKNFKEWYL